jgi:hypothetical protein
MAFGQPLDNHNFIRQNVKRIHCFALIQAKTFPKFPANMNEYFVQYRFRSFPDFIEQHLITIENQQSRGVHGT